MIRNGVAFGIGAAVGVVAVGIGMAVYYYYRKKQTVNTDKEAAASEKFTELLKVSEGSKKSLKELTENRMNVELLTVKEITGWFKENKNDLPDNIKMIVFIPTEKMLKGLGYAITERIDPDRNIIQLFYDDEKKEAVRIRLVHYSDIDSNLQAHLIEEDGMIVITE